MASTWTPERVELLTKYWLEGLSASNISNKLGDVSRNAVIGKVHRLGLPARIASRGKTGSPLKTSSLNFNISDDKDNDIDNKAYWSDTSLDDVDLTYNDHIVNEQQYDNNISLVLALKNGSCKWPHGNPGESDFGFCGKESKAGTPYCEEHNQEAYHKITPIKKHKKVKSPMHQEKKKLA